MSLVRFIAGAMNSRENSAKFYVFLASPLLSKEALINPRLVRESNELRTELSRFVVRTLGETWVSWIIEAQEGTILRAFGNRVHDDGLGLGLRRVSANQYIRVREGAVHRKIELKSPHTPAAYIEGRFDLLTFDEAKGLGAPAQECFRGYSLDAMTSRAFSYHTLAPALAERPPPVAVSVPIENGSTAQVLVRQRRRLYPK